MDKSNASASLCDDSSTSDLSSTPDKGADCEGSSSSKHYHIDLPCSIAAWLAEYLMSRDPKVSPEVIPKVVEQVRNAGVPFLAITFLNESERLEAFQALSIHFGEKLIASFRDEVVSLLGD